MSFIKRLFRLRFALNLREHLPATGSEYTDLGLHRAGILRDSTRAETPFVCIGAMINYCVLRMARDISRILVYKNNSFRL